MESRFNKKIRIASQNLLQRRNKRNLPKLYILDAGKKLPFASDSLDFIYSVASIQYIHDKALFLEEMNRILKKKGIAKLQASFKKKDSYPIELRNLLEIWEDGKRIEFEDYILKIRRFKNIQFKKTRKNIMGYMLMKKDKNFKMDLEYIASFDLHRLGKELWGTKVIYKVK